MLLRWDVSDLGFRYSGFNFDLKAVVPMDPIPERVYTKIDRPR